MSEYPLPTTALSVTDTPQHMLTVTKPQWFEYNIIYFSDSDMYPDPLPFPLLMLLTVS